jgi:hypothetical protein
MNHQFYTSAPALGPVYTLQYFNAQDPSKDSVFYTENVMRKIREVTDGQPFYYQFDNANNTAHCVKACFVGNDLVILRDEVRATQPGSDSLTEVLDQQQEFPMVQGEGGMQYTFDLPKDKPTQLGMF